MTHTGLKIALALVVLGASLAGVAAPAAATTCYVGETPEEMVDGVRCSAWASTCPILRALKQDCI